MLNTHLVTTIAIALGIVTLSLSTEAAPAKGPLKAHPDNPRYFTDGSGKAVYLTGSHIWNNIQDWGTTDPPPPLDYSAFLDFVAGYNHNFIRGWAWEQAAWVPWSAKAFYLDPVPYMRTGPGNSLDGKPKFDLTKFNQAYFDRLRARVREAGDRGIYVSVMLFQGWSVFKGTGGKLVGNPWPGHPFNCENNINGIDGDPNETGEGKQIHTMSDGPKVKAVREFQEAYVRKVIDTVNDLDNVLYEIGNEMGKHSTAWQYHMISYIKEYEKKKPKQHPVGMTFQWSDGKNEDLVSDASPADWVSFGPGSGNIYRENPPAADGRKVSILDTDHLWGIGGNRAWVWKSFTRGHNPIFMDPNYNIPDWGHDPNDPAYAEIRAALGHARGFADKLNLAAMKPSDSTSSTGYALVNPGKEYLVYQPEQGKGFEVKLRPGSYSFEWFDAGAGKVDSSSKTDALEAEASFTPPFKRDAVLYLKALKR